jgi:hypothetical protein
VAVEEKNIRTNRARTSVLLKSFRLQDKKDIILSHLPLEITQKKKNSSRHRYKHPQTVCF